MKQDSSTESWNKIDNDWINFAQKNDYRMYFIMPYTLNQIGNVDGKIILDIGCGEGGYSRALAKDGAIVTAIDCAENALNYSIMRAEKEQLNISHYLRNSNDLYDIPNKYFDIVLSSMMLMDCEDLNGTINEIARVLKPGGKLFVSITHPCFTGKDIHSQINNGKREVIVENYFEPVEWQEKISSAFDTEVIFRHRTLQDYIKSFVKYGLKITDLNEPIPNEEQIARSNRINRLTKVPMFLFIELEKQLPLSMVGSR